MAIDHSKSSGSGEIISNEEWIKQAKAQAIDIVSTATYPWTDRQLRIWYIGILCDVFNRAALQIASLDKLKEWHRELSK